MLGFIAFLTLPIAIYYAIIGLAGYRCKDTEPELRIRKQTKTDHKSLWTILQQ